MKNEEQKRKDEEEQERNFGGFERFKENVETKEIEYILAL